MAKACIEARFPDARTAREFVAKSTLTEPAAAASPSAKHWLRVPFADAGRGQLVMARIQFESAPSPGRSREARARAAEDGGGVGGCPAEELLR